MNLKRRFTVSHRRARRARIVLAGWLCATVFAFGLLAQDWSTAPPEKVGLSAERLGRITAALENDVTSKRVPGALALVFRHGKVAYVEARGTADIEAGRKIQADTIFRIYSMSKPITSVAVMMLYEEGRFSLKDPVSKYIPELRGLKVLVEHAPETKELRGGVSVSGDSVAAESPGYHLVEPKREMTVQDLLRHTSGLTYGVFGDSKVDEMYKQAHMLDPDVDLAGLVKKLGKIPLKHQPGSTWEYSVSVDVLGRLVEVISGRPFDEFLRERLFAPLKMADTGFYVPAEKLARFAQLYRKKEGGGFESTDSEAGTRYMRKPDFLSGGGGMVSTAADYLRFCRMLLNGGELDGARILSRKTIELMTANHLNQDIAGGPGSGYGFGLGFAVMTNLGQSALNGSLGEFNWSGLAGTKFWIDPKEEMIGIYMVQVLPPREPDTGNTFKVLAYQAIAD